MKNKIFFYILIFMISIFLSSNSYAGWTSGWFSSFTSKQAKDIAFHKKRWAQYQKDLEKKRDSYKDYKKDDMSDPDYREYIKYSVKLRESDKKAEELDKSVEAGSTVQMIKNAVYWTAEDLANITQKWFIENETLIGDLLSQNYTGLLASYLDKTAKYKIEKWIRETLGIDVPVIADYAYDKFLHPGIKKFEFVSLQVIKKELTYRQNEVRHAFYKQGEKAAIDMTKAAATNLGKQGLAKIIDGITSWWGAIGDFQEMAVRFAMLDEQEVPIKNMLHAIKKIMISKKLDTYEKAFLYWQKNPKDEKESNVAENDESESESKIVQIEPKQAPPDAENVAFPSSTSMPTGSGIITKLKKTPFVFGFDTIIMEGYEVQKTNLKYKCFGWCGKKNGKWIGKYKDTGTKGCVGNFLNGKRHGQWIFWHKNGKLKKIESFINDKREGEVKTWWSNGKAQSVEHYTADKKNGLYTSWHDNGTLREEGSYKNGVKVGNWISLRKNGSLDAKVTYSNGKATKTETGKLRRGPNGVPLL